MEILLLEREIMRVGISHMNTVMLFFFLILGFIAASLGISAGLAGGVLIVPVLLFLGFPASEVIGSVQAALILPVLLASIDGLKRKEVNIKFAVIFEASTIVGAWIGAYFTKILPDFYMKVLFSLLAFMFSYLMISRKADKTKLVSATDVSEELLTMKSLQASIFQHIKTLNQRLRPHFELKLNDDHGMVSIPLMIFFGLTIGFFAGMLGIAGGWLKTPLMVLVYEFPPHSATSTALFMALITVSGGTLAHWYLGHVKPMMTIPLTLGLVMGSALSLRIKHRLSSEKLPVFIAFMLVVVGMILLFSTVLQLFS